MYLWYIIKDSINQSINQKKQICIIFNIISSIIKNCYNMYLIYY